MSQACEATTNCSSPPFHNIHNLRDLGGLHNSDNRRVRTGRLFRSGNPGKASASDIARLQTLGIHEVIDFRTREEKSAAESTFANAFNWTALPVLAGNMNMNEMVPRLSSATRQDIDEFMLQMYRDFPIKQRSAFGTFMKTAETGSALLYHCSAGKDRTGFATFLLLSALDVAPDAILANYLESNHCNRQFIQELLARLEPLGIAPEVAMPLLEVRAGYLQASLQVIEQEWGSTERFLREALAVDVQCLREYYLERVD
ncbi:Putative tyrosine-protein phosphatase H16_A0669 [Pseudomonas sp. 9AZ]|uniref:tyrosine-protein phosphatase n=1 Tax=Pseudomonas sp. 9AZ TaxID=2653168 RepID=UPI0012F22408|nr:tyrosine-protein phosphatase [Pseudomonas sp. 9AZ]VXD04347.1 Putative tyrosine-protein phosphatase H16_A0669 [Pseudomonas sp. 9AZ]